MHFSACHIRQEATHSHTLQIHKLCEKIYQRVLTAVTYEFQYVSFSFVVLRVCSSVTFLSLLSFSRLVRRFQFRNSKVHHYVLAIYRLY